MSFFSLPLFIIPSAFPSSKTTGSFHQRPLKTSFQFSQLEECQFTAHLMFFPYRKVAIIAGNQRDKPIGSDHLSQAHHTAAGLV